jgi:hypothetical protein
VAGASRTVTVSKPGSKRFMKVLQGCGDECGERVRTSQNDAVELGICMF